MIQSMTAFATRIVSFPLKSNTDVTAILTLKTVNGRFFDMNYKIPHVLAIIESHLSQRCRTLLHRGTVTFSLQLSHPLALKTTVTPSYELAAGYIEALKTLKQQFNLSGDITLQDIVQLPNLFESTDVQISENIITMLIKACDDLIHDVITMRTTEGAALERDILNNILDIESYIEQLIPRAEIITQQRTEHFLQQVREILATTPEDVRSTHLQSLYQNIEKIEVNEEFIRLKAHIAALRQTLEVPDLPHGKKLDFILQEMFREINTLSAKLVDAASLGPIIDIKTRLERMREQVQNIV